MLATSSLTERVAEVLPKGYNFRLYHVSTPPTKTSAIYSAPPGTRPDKTYRESHFLALSIDAPGKPSDATEEGPSELLVYAVEVLIYSTAFSTTFFVSKADSTGYLHLLKLPNATSSSIKTTTSTFLEYLVQKRRRPGIRTIISLFARAQDQYLFPGSAENWGKHVLDDRGLVRWWCRVLDPVILKSAESIEDRKCRYGSWARVKGYLVVPGSDATRTYLPTEARIGPESEWRWEIGHPLEEITRHPVGVPPRCLIPHFPDDPKSRYLDDLDGELKNASLDGQWTSVKSVEQFWDAMSFRQECSAGRIVGFLWVVFTPTDLNDNLRTSALTNGSQNTDSQTTVDEDVNPALIDPTEPSSSPASSFILSGQVSPLKTAAGKVPSNAELSKVSTRLKQATPRKHKKKLRGIIISRHPRFKTRSSLRLQEFPENTAYYSCPADSRGQILLGEKDYKRVTELLLRLDFADEILACQSSRRWINEVRAGVASSDEPWGVLVTGTHEPEQKADIPSAAVNSLNVGLVRKKRTLDTQNTSASSVPTARTSASAINVLGSGMVRKKLKV